MCYWWYVEIALSVLATILIIVGCIVKKSSRCDSYGDYFGGSPAPLDIGLVLLVIAVMCTVIFGSIFLIHKGRAYSYKEKYDYVMQVVETMSDNQFANLGITNTILDYNSWLAQAKASKSAYGNWSFYKNIDLESMHYLGVGQ